MGATMEALPGRPQGLRSSTLKKPFSLRAGDSRILVEPDGSVRSFDSLSERRALFGFERPWLYKVQAGVVVQAPRTDWSVRANPRSAQLTARVFESIDVSQSIEFFRGSSSGYVRKFKAKNGGSAPAKLRLMDLFDPAAAQLGDTAGRWGSLGLNAFNRESHVAMDEVSDPPAARVVGALPPPTKFYMTTDRSRAQDLTAAGELPDATAGMSGQVLILSQHDIDLSPGESKEIAFASIYNPQRLEDALSAFGRLHAGESAPRHPGAAFACSSQQMTETASWAAAALDGAQFVKDPLDRFESATSLSLIDPLGARQVLEQAKAMVTRDGSMPHSLDPTRPGVLESAVLLRALAWHLGMARDRKLSRSLFPLVKKVASYLMSVSNEYKVQTDPSLPQGWRRHLGRGYPTGEIPEVSLAAAGGLAGASQVARQLSKSGDAGRWRERSEMIADGVRRRLLDERGFLALCLDSSGRLRSDETIDMAVAAFRHPFSQSAEQAAAHRLMEKDFETTYGPRCVPVSNQVYFNRAYGRGQLGGFWTRAALAQAVLCYRVGLAGIGSLALQKVAKLVADDCTRVGGGLGEFPYWVDVEGGEAHGDDTDQVAAARFIEGFVSGEMGLALSSDRVSLAPPASSGLGWAMAADFWTGEPATAFVGRSAGWAHVFVGAAKVEAKDAMKFSKAEVLDLTTRGIFGLSFHGPGQVICVGNSLGTPVRTTVTFAPRAADLSKRLSTPLEALDPAKGTWARVATLRVFPTMSFEASLGPNEWKAFRVSTL